MEYVSIREQSTIIDGVELRLLMGHAERLHEVLTPYQMEHSALHTHAMAELFACKSGKVFLSIGADNSIALQSGDIAIVPPNIYHAIEKPTDEKNIVAFSFGCMGRPTDSEHPLLRLCDVYEQSKIHLWHDKADFCRMAESIEEMMLRGERLLPVLLLAQLGASLTSQESERIDTTIGPDVSKKNYDMQRLLLLDIILQNEHIKKIKIEEVAERLHVSPRQFNRIVRMRYGKTWHQVLMERRVGTAEYLLSTTDMSVDAVRIYVGFSSAASFYKEFARVYGITPAKYRKRLEETR